MAKFDAHLKCSFCGKSQEQVRKLIAGPGVYICDECIDLCNEILDEELIDAQGGGRQGNEPTRKSGSNQPRKTTKPAPTRTSLAMPRPASRLARARARAPTPRPSLQGQQLRKPALRQRAVSSLAVSHRARASQ